MLFIKKKELSYEINLIFAKYDIEIFMKELLTLIKNQINEGQLSEATEQLQHLIQSNTEYADQAHYLMGNICRKRGDWQGALNHYQEAIDLNPESPAKEARAMAMDILNFYNKDMFNQ